MAKIKLITWNTFGSIFNKDEKKQVIIDLIKQYSYENNNPVFFIQEAGKSGTSKTNAEFWNDNYCIATYSSFQSDKSLTSLAMMYPQNKIPYKFHDYAIITTQLSRPVACLGYEGKLIMANIHATPSPFPNLNNHSQGAKDICSTIEILSKGTTPWLIIGDMNCPPKELDAYDKFTRLKKIAKIINPNVNTHTFKHGNDTFSDELDYVIASDSVAKYINCVGVVNVWPISDHNPVIYDLDLCW